MQRHLIGPGVNISGNTLIFKCVGLGKQGRHIPAYTVSANASHYRSHTVSDQIAQSCFRCSRMKSAFAASAHDMLMTVDKSGNSSHSVCINHFDLYAAAKISGQVFSYCRDFISQDQNILYSEIFRLIYFCVFYNLNNRHVSSLFY